MPHFSGSAFRAARRGLTSLLLCLVSVCAAATPSESGLPILQNFLARDIPATPRFFDGATDENGIPFFCNGSNIVTFNGSEWRKFRPKPDSVNLRGLAFGDDGHLYVGGLNVFGRVRRPGEQFESLIEHLPESERAVGQITQIVRHHGSIHFVGLKNIYVWRDEKFIVLPLAGARLHATAAALYVTAPKQPLLRLEQGVLTPVSEAPLFREQDIRLVCEALDGGLIIAPQQGGFFRLPTAPGAAPTPWKTDADELLRAKQIYVARQLADGTIALGFTIVSGGTAIFIQPDGRCALKLDEASGLQDENIQGFLPDRDGGLWLSLANGLARIQGPSAYSYFGKINGLSPTQIYGIVRLNDVLHVANSTGLFRLVPGALPQQSARFEVVARGETYFIERWRDGLLITGSQEVRWLDPHGALQSVHKPTPAASLGRATASRADPNRIWIGGARGLRSVYFQDGAWVDEGPVEGITGNISYILEDGDRALWCSGPNSGFIRLESEATLASRSRPAFKFTRYTEGSGLPTTVVIGRILTWDGDFLFNISGSEVLLRFDRERRLFYPVPGLRLPGDALMQPGVDHPDHLWLSTDTITPALWRIHRATRDGQLETLPQIINQPIGAVNRFFEEHTPAGRVLWAGGVNGLMRVDLDRAPPAASPLNTQIVASITPGEIRPHDVRDASFEFFAPRFQPGSAVEYQTQLVGHDREPSAWSADRKRSYTNLAPGEYRFVVRARDVDGRESPPVTLAFAQRPPWWRTWPAWLGLGLVAGSGVFGVVRLRTLALERRNAQLEKVVATRTTDLRRQNQELARLHQLELDEKITARLAAEKAQLEVLRYQLNPHFLFNSLTSIRAQIPPALNGARDTLDKLADFCRHTLQGRKPSESSTCGEEFAMLRSYLDIEQTRLSELLSLQIEFDPALESEPLPRLLLLPLVENALKYGLATSEPPLQLRLTARREADGAILFEIANTGRWVAQPGAHNLPSHGIGHDNLRERMRRHFPDAHEFSHHEQDGWVVVRLRLTPRAAG